MLNQGSEEAKLAYNEAKEAKMRVRKVKNEEWIRLGEEWRRMPRTCRRDFDQG